MYVSYDMFSKNVLCVCVWGGGGGGGEFFDSEGGLEFCYYAN